MIDRKDYGDLFADYHNYPKKCLLCIRQGVWTCPKNNIQPQIKIVVGDKSHPEPLTIEAGGRF